MKTSWRSASFVVGAVAVLALTTACGQEEGAKSASENVGAAGVAAPAAGYGSTGGGYDAGTGGTDGQAAGAGAADGQPIAAEGAGKLAVATDAELGEMLTDSAGRTLYRFDQDTAEPPKTNCDGDCATAWPPVLSDDASAGEGIDPALLGEVTRSDGTKQLTVGGWPAYRYAKDVNPGDTNGQGVKGTWFALAPDGKKATLASLPGLSTRKDPKLGEIVVDRNGMTVYRFMKDEAWPKPVSACTDACLDKWPVVEPVATNDTKGVAKKGLMSFTRPDGQKQQTVNCWPIYTFAGDKAPGDTNGQGVGGTWYAVAPDGKPIGAPKE
ncbi:SCO0930 family lipoprotein [Streptomyces sp. NPDC093094]|uniref:SCO0930 family lipoprotein n=1 Tax=Streptomyces sp. NPDC093094 TaxID=3366026 RepID=UPI003818039B